MPFPPSRQERARRTCAHHQYLRVSGHQVSSRSCQSCRSNAIETIVKRAVLDIRILKGEKPADLPVQAPGHQPQDGARYGNWLLRKIPLISPKIHQLADIESTFENYRIAIRAAKPRKVNRPKQLHIRMEDD